MGSRDSDSGKVTPNASTVPYPTTTVQAHWYLAGREAERRDTAERERASPTPCPALKDGKLGFDFLDDCATARTCHRKPNPHWKCCPECPNYRGPACPTCGSDARPLPGTPEYLDPRFQP